MMRMTISLKILYLPSIIDNGIEDIVYAGLNKLDNVEIYEYPFKPLYHVDKTEQRHELFPVSPWFKQNGRDENCIYRSFDDIEFDKFDIIIVGSLNRDLLQYIPRIMKLAPDRTVYLDGGDDPFIRLILKDAALYFKREKLSSFNISTMSHYKFAWYFKKLMVDAINYGHHTFPLPPLRSLMSLTLSLNLTVIAHQFSAREEKDIDVSFILRTRSSPLRQKYERVVSNLAKEKNLNVYVKTDGLDWKSYTDIILRSKISVSLPGEGYDTYRYWEIPYYGTCMISPYLPLAIDNNFEDGFSALFFKNEDEFSTKVVKTLKSGEYDQIGKNGKLWFERHHSDVKRAEKVIYHTRDLLL